jgi:hypothetical protein
MISMEITHLQSLKQSLQGNVYVSDLSQKQMHHEFLMQFQVGVHFTNPHMFLSQIPEAGSIGFNGAELLVANLLLSPAMD